MWWLVLTVLMCEGLAALLIAIGWGLNWWLTEGRYR